MKLFISVIGAVIFSIGGLLMALGMQLISHEKNSGGHLGCVAKTRRLCSIKGKQK